MASVAGTAAKRRVLKPANGPQQRSIPGEKALGWFALSSENLGGVSSQHEQPVASSALKALLQHRQRLLSLMSYPAKLKQEGVAGVLGVHLGAHKPLGQPSAPAATIFRAGQTRLPRRVVHLALAQGPHHQAGQRQRWRRAWQAAALCAGQQLRQSLHRHALLLGDGGEAAGRQSADTWTRSDESLAWATSSPSSTFTKLSSLLAGLSSLLAGLSSLLAGSSSLLTGPSRLLGLLGKQVTLLAELVQAVSARPTE
ncbi:hypothetical protein PCASD_21755 [Puccinia coronata f. sp. avenae]|uniref:Uncharacterized protein n=1 Tax=Puccinia coronata f. sp. avenae TaxID=200324 RepID=A0A2N5TX01_9BASI|nr:hypothetical protein PCASD_21755 [Puccinia coronata f. sp. avenae]